MTSLDIKAPDWQIIIRGKEPFIEDTYDVLREFLIAHLETSLQTPTKIRVPKGPGRLALEIEICHDHYRRTHLIERRNFQTSPLGEKINTSELVKIFVERPARQMFNELLPLGKPLWTALTNAGTKTATSIHKKILK